MPVTITRRTTTVILLQGDDAEELQRLRDHAAALRRRAEVLRKSNAKPVLVSDDDPVLEAEDAADAAEQEADAFAAEALLASKATFTLTDTDVTEVGMSFVTDGDVTVELDDATRDAWIVSVDFQQVES